jgi:bifunctional DNA-binding transcriptional regulator/antitoxin component of YhaV-PrlF toxin-antitoxin module
MPRLVKGGKLVYGWSEVSNDGNIVIPDETLAEYNLKPPCKVILLSGSRSSSEFAITTVSLLKNSALSRLLNEKSKLASFQLPEGVSTTVAKKPCCWVTLNSDGCIVVPLETLKKYGINIRDLLLSVRGSRLGLGFCVKGPLINEAKQHSGLIMFK